MSLIVVLALVAAACSDPDPAAATFPSLLDLSAGGEVPPLDEDRVRDGRELYVQSCAVCHGLDLLGDPDWKTPNADGSYRPPPHDASGHTWHHSDQLLIEIISEGSGAPLTIMPKFGTILTQDEILSILEFFKSTWGPDERLFQWEQTRRAAES